MNRRVARKFAFGILAFLILTFIAVIQVVQTDWFRNYVREKIISATQDAIGGRVELGSFSFDWRHLRAEVTEFVIHGSEPTDASPFVRVKRMQVDVRLFTSFKRILDVRQLLVEQPQVNILTFADGTMNIPKPAKESTSDTTPLETIVDLAIGHFELSDGLLHFNAEAQPMDVRGENLQVQLAYNILTQGYRGQLSLQPIYVVQGRNTPVVFTVTLPVVLENDKISFTDATISTSASELKVTGSVANLKQPEIQARVNGHVAVSDLNALGNLTLMPTAAISQMRIDADGQVASDAIRINRLQLQAGNSRIDAIGLAKDAQGNGTLDFSSTLNLTELSQLAKLPQQLSGEVNIDGTTRFTGNLLSLENARIRVWGGELRADGSLEDLERYQVVGTLDRISLQTVEQRLGIKPLPYDGTVGGDFQAQGDLKASDGELRAKMNLQITPGRRDIPLSGRMNAEYDAKTGLLQARNSYLALPNSRLNLAGTLPGALRLELTSQNLNELFAAIPGTAPEVRLNNGTLKITATVAGTVDSPQVTGHASSTRLAIQQRQFDAIATDFSANKSHAALQKGSLARGTMQGDFAASLGLVNWSPKPSSPLMLMAALNNGDLGDIVALAGQNPDGYSGTLIASANVSGTFGNPTGAASISVTHGTIASEPFDEGQLQVSLTDQLIQIPSAYLMRDTSRISLNANFTHPRETLTSGHLRARVNSTPIELGTLRNLQSRRAGTAGVFQINASVEGDLSSAQVENTDTADFELTSVSGDISANNLQIDRVNYGDVTARANTSADTVTYNVSSNFASSRIQISGNTQLRPDYLTDLNANIDDLPIERVLAAANRSDVAARGMASGTAHLAGTLKEPRGQAEIQLRNAVVSDEPVDRMRLRANVEPTLIELTSFEANAGPSQITLSGRFDHAPNTYQEGKIEFQIRTNRLDLARIRNVQMRRPGLGGILEISADGRGEVGSPQSQDRLAFQMLNAQINATGIQAAGRNLGDLQLAAFGTSDKLNFTLDSGLANATIRGRGDAALRGDYPVNAEVTFDDVTWANLQPLIQENIAGRPSVDGTTSGRLTLNGPVANLDQLNASLRVTKFEVRALEAQPLRQRPLTIQNQGDIAASIQRGQIRIDSAHLTGDQTDINVTGTTSLRGEDLNIRIDAESNLELVEAFVPDIYSGGTVTIAATVQGSATNPSITGRIELQDASLASGDLPLGLSKANGVIALNGNTATIQKLTGEAGGGRINVEGFVTRGEQLRFSLRATAATVRVRVQQGVSAVATANLNITGTASASVVSGSVTIDRLTYLPQTDIGAILARSGPPVQSPASPSPILENMRVDISVRSSTTTAIQASLAQNLQVSADLRVRGRASEPGITGSVQLSRGDLVFFGSTYRVSSGTISFYNPNRIEPQIDITLETEAKGATVVLNVTGPIDNMKLSYTSDPPLQFDEIVALLAAGKAPTSDPTLLANQPSQPAQTLEQRGEAALLGKAVADPLANRLQRVFGVSQLKIDPSFTSGSQVPQARLTLQQQVAPNLLFTYVTALDNPNTQIARIEWSMTPQWSATANRDENGIVSINFLYKKQFR